jgi:transposase
VRTKPPLLEISPQLEHALLDLVALGVSLRAAARAVGVSERAVYEWVQRGRSDDQPSLYSRFAAGLRDAQTEREQCIRMAIATAQLRCAQRGRPGP